MAMKIWLRSPNSNPCKLCWNSSSSSGDIVQEIFEKKKSRSSNSNQLFKMSVLQSIIFEIIFLELVMLNFLTTTLLPNSYPVDLQQFSCIHVFLIRVESFIALYLWSIGINYVLSQSRCKGTILQRNYRKRP